MIYHKNLSTENSLAFYNSKFLLPESYLKVGHTDSRKDPENTGHQSSCWFQKREERGGWSAQAKPMCPP